ncbi:MAG: hypothetical protein LRY73_09845 [Bacillus sp. (in: Bacteria)]|nr:hypothetical protein [Bacillus sp. (in: firmicutes)]
MKPKLSMEIRDTWVFVYRSNIDLGLKICKVTDQDKDKITKGFVNLEMIIRNKGFKKCAITRVGIVASKKVDEFVINYGYFNVFISQDAHKSTHNLPTNS